MSFNNTFPIWENTGIEPSDQLKSTGFEARYKPPASVFNWFWNKMMAAITEMQEILTPHEAKSNDGLVYTVTIDGITKLYNGLTITVIPNMSSTSVSGVTLNLNGLGAKRIRMTLPFTSGNSGATATNDGWFSADAPITLRYHEKMDTWKTDLQRMSAQALYGSLNASETSSLGLRGDIEILNGENMNDYAEIGNYCCENTSTAATLINAPWTDTRFNLMMMYPSTTSTSIKSYAVQVAVNEIGRIKVRNRPGTSAEWTDWRGVPNVTYGTTEPSGGSDGDIYIMYEE